MRFDFNVDTTGGCGYGYSVFYMFGAAPYDLTGYTRLRFWLKGAAGGEEVNLRLKVNSDPCLGSFNFGYYTITATDQWVEHRLPFTAFSNRNDSCPFFDAGLHAAVDTVEFIRDNVDGGGTIYFDDVRAEP